MVHLTSSTVHHESGPTKVSRDTSYVTHVMAAVKANPFSSKSLNLVKIITRQWADP